MVRIAAAALGLLIAVISAKAQTADYAGLGKAVIEDFATGHFDKAEAQFDLRMATAAPTSVMQNLWQHMIAQQGPFQAVTNTSTTNRGPYHIAVVTAEFQKGPIDFLVAFDSEGKVAGLHLRPGSAPWSPPDYAHPMSFHEKPVTVGAKPYILPGTLTLPDGKGPFPAVVLVQGSGAYDQDETIGPNKPFKDLAWGLASRGVAVLRYVKRTKQYPRIVEMPGFTVMQESVVDARSAVNLLAQGQADPEVNPKRIFVLGHSLGGMLAPRIAEDDPQVAGIILMAGNTESLGSALVRQIKYEISLAGQPTPAEEKTLAAAEAVQKETENPSLKPSDKINILGSVVPGSYILDLRAYHPAETAARLKIPMLILQGGRDFNVTVPDDFDVWKKALVGHPNVEYRFYPTLDHLFMTGSEPPNPRDGYKPGHVSEQVVSDIADWVKEQR